MLAQSPLGASGIEPFSATLQPGTTFPPVSNIMLPTSFCKLPESPFNIHICKNILFITIHVLSETIEAFSNILPPSF